MPPPDPAAGSTAFLLALTRHQGQLYAAVSALLGQPEGVEDVVQETNLVLLKKAAEYDPARPFLPWALTFARFQALAWRKRQKRDRLRFDDELVGLLADEFSARPADRHPALRALEQCLEALPPEARRLVDERYRDGDAVQAIAARHGRTVSGVSVALFRVRKALLECVRRKAAEGTP